jgi:prepilin-type N-terminal cleavage/methylation domain-containing protein
MVLSNIKKRAQDRGFTIVELLIVIVVIGILAAIVIVAYSGITSKANLQKSVTNATAMRDVAEAANADNGKYPALTTDFTTGSASTRLPAGVTPQKGGGTGGTSYANVAAAVTATTTTTSITTPSFLLSGTAANPTGGVIIYWDPTLATPGLSTTYIYYGAATSASAFLAPAS